MSAYDEVHLADRRLTEFFLREEARKKRAAAPSEPLIPEPPVITISRQFAAGGHSVAEALVKRLGPPWEIWEKGILEAVADAAHVRREMVEALDEHALSWLEEVLRRSTGVGVMEAGTYRKHLSQVVVALAQQGHIIIIGRGANFILPHALNVRLRASFEYRLKHTMQRENLAHDPALKRMHQVDHERADFTRSIFGREIDDINAYDMVLRTDTLGLEAAVAAVAAAIECRERANKPERAYATV